MIQPSELTTGMVSAGLLDPAEHQRENTQGSAHNVTYRRSTDQSIEIAIVDDRQLMRDCFGKSLATIEPAFRFHYYMNIEDFEHAHPQLDPAPSILLMMVTWATTKVEYHLSQIAHVRDMMPNTGIIVVSDIEQFGDILKAIENGARGYIPTSISLAVAAKAIHLVAAGGVYIPASVLLQSNHTSKNGDVASKPNTQTDAAFTSRQLAVVDALRRGKANKVIAYDLNMCESTVKVHIRNVMKKLHARNRTEIAYILNTSPYSDIFKKE
jgi:DNA-binding NarL/FixJ family response regulator